MNPVITSPSKFPLSLKAVCLLLPVFTVLTSCKESNSPSDPETHNVSEQDLSEPPNSKQSALKKSSDVTARIAAGLKSFYHVGEESLEIQKINENSQRAILRIPIVASEDLYQESQSGIYRVIEKVKDKGDTQTVVFILTGSKGPGGWNWHESIEENVAMDSSFLPRGRFAQDVMFKDSEEHLARIKEDARLSEEADAAKSEKLAKIRQGKVSALAAVLKVNAKAVGTINGGNFQFVVTEADVSVPYWTIIPSRMSRDRKKIYRHATGDGPITISYDETQGECIVAEVQSGSLLRLRGAVVIVTANGLTFEGNQIQVAAPGFRFE